MTYVLRGRNVCELLPLGATLLARVGERQDSRAGPVIAAPMPVMSVYDRPIERVLLSPARDANPFFHLMESLWMLSGRNDSAFLNCYVSDFGERFAEPDGTIHGAYGHRWRHALGHDQLDEIISRLRKDSSDRQCVLQMWDTRELIEEDGSNNVDLGNDDLQGNWKDRPCNTHVYFRVRQVTNVPDHAPRNTLSVLDMTVCCRSNDIVWGAYGANAVHFSMLMEYVAGRAGYQVGTMYQLSNNWHGYVKTMDKLGAPEALRTETQAQPYDWVMGYYAPMPIGEDWETWDSDLSLFMAWHDGLWSFPDGSTTLGFPDGWRNTWFAHVAWPAALANWLHKKHRRDEAMMVVDRIEAGDWRIACREWLLRRYAR